MRRSSIGSPCTRIDFPRCGSCRIARIPRPRARADLCPRYDRYARRRRAGWRAGSRRPAGRARRCPFELGLAGRIALDQLDAEPDPRERRAQLVRCIGEQHLVGLDQGLDPGSGLIETLASCATSSRPSTSTRALRSPAPSDCTPCCNRSRRRSAAAPPAARRVPPRPRGHRGRR